MSHSKLSDQEFQHYLDTQDVYENSRYTWKGVITQLGFDPRRCACRGCSQAYTDYGEKVGFSCGIDGKGAWHFNDKGEKRVKHPIWTEEKWADYNKVDKPLEVREQ